MSAFHLWTPPRSASDFWVGLTPGRMLPSVRPLMRRCDAAGPYGSSRTGSTSPVACFGSTVECPGSSGPVSPTVAPYPPSTTLRPRQPRARRITRRPELGKPRPWPAAPRRCAPSCWPAPRSPACAACGPASAPATSLPARRACCLQHDRAALPMISRRRSVRSPIRDDRAELLLAAGRSLQRRQPNPGGEVAALAEGLRRGASASMRGRGDRTDAGDGHQPPRLSSSRARWRSRVSRGGSARRAPEARDHHHEHVARGSAAGPSGILDLRDQRARHGTAPWARSSHTRRDDRGWR